jgi:hypothetical protein
VLTTTLEVQAVENQEVTLEAHQEVHQEVRRQALQEVCRINLEHKLEQHLINPDDPAGLTDHLENQLLKVFRGHVHLRLTSQEGVLPQNPGDLSET